MWVLSLAADSSTHRSVSYFDIRIRLCASGVLYNMHLVVVPFYDRHTAENVAGMLCKILDAMYRRWRAILIAFSYDGENTMTGRHAGVVTRIDREAEAILMRIWCPPHQIDLVVKVRTNDMDEGAFYRIAQEFNDHLRRHANLIREIKSTCPRDTNQWVHFKRILTWMLQWHKRLFDWVAEKHPLSAPSKEWWLFCVVFQLLLVSVNVTMVILQSRDMILSQKEKEIEVLVEKLTIKMRLGWRI